MLLQITAFTSPFQSPIITSTSITKHYLNTDKSLNPSTHFLGTALFPSLGRGLYLGLGSRNRSRNSHVNRVNASLLEAPVLWVGRMCIFYALVKLGLAGSPETPLSPGLIEDELMGICFSFFICSFFLVWVLFLFSWDGVSWVESATVF